MTRITTRSRILRGIVGLIKKSFGAVRTSMPRALFNAVRVLFRASGDEALVNLLGIKPPVLPNITTLKSDNFTQFLGDLVPTREVVLLAELSPASRRCLLFLHALFSLLELLVDELQCRKTNPPAERSENNVVVVPDCFSLLLRMLRLKSLFQAVRDFFDRKMESVEVNLAALDVPLEYPVSTFST
jgi:hypothetical protein